MYARARSSFLPTLAAFLLAAPFAAAQQTSQQIVDALLINERAAIQHRQHYLYLSVERSDRTGGHAWTERVAEMPLGKVRFLIAEDGHPLSPERETAERGRLANLLRDPDAFQRREQALKNDEAHAQQMLELLPHAFVFDPPVPEAGNLRIAFRPNPDYHPKSYEERVLHGMSGSILVDPRHLRLHSIAARLPQDVSIGYGFLATIHAGSNFNTTRAPAASGELKTSLIDIAIYGKAIFFKAISKNEHAEHTDFKLVPPDLTLPQAVALVER